SSDVCSSDLAQVVDAASRRTVAVCQHADHRQDGGVAGYRAIDHVGENVGNLLIENEVGGGALGGKNLVRSGLAHGDRNAAVSPGKGFAYYAAIHASFKPTHRQPDDRAG